MRAGAGALARNKVEIIEIMSKTVFITGGANGIGAAAVTKFRDEGWNVLFTDIHEPSCKPEGTCFVKADSRNKASFCTGGHYLCDGGLVCR